MVMEQLQQQISGAWVKEGLTIFADDHWAAWKVEDRQTLKQALSGIQTVIIKVLEDTACRSMPRNPPYFMTSRARM